MMATISATCAGSATISQRSTAPMSSCGPGATATRFPCPVCPGWRAAFLAARSRPTHCGHSWPFRLAMVRLRSGADVGTSWPQGWPHEWWIR